VRHRPDGHRLVPYLKYGPFHAGHRLLKRALRKWVEWGTLVFLEQDLQGTPPVEGSNAHAIRELSGVDLSLLSTFPNDPAELANRLERGDRAFAYCEARTGMVLHVRWVTTLPTWIPELALWLHPGAGEIYLYDVMTHPLHRGQRLAGMVGGAMDAAFAGQGFRKKLGYVRTDNPAMMRSMKWARVPLRELFRVSYVRWRGRAPCILGSHRPPLYAQED